MLHSQDVKQSHTDKDPGAVLIDWMPGHAVFDIKLSFFFIQLIDEFHFGERTAHKQRWNEHTFYSVHNLMIPLLLFGCGVYLIISTCVRMYDSLIWGIYDYLKWLKNEMF